ncbi:acetyl-CoA synthetase-like protein [Xylariaceae sp. FL0016]|nr:acetyl-CoA synthetase-like protein [Xylariaceae sp. FL0016]
MRLGGGGRRTLAATPDALGLRLIAVTSPSFLCPFTASSASLTFRTASGHPSSWPTSQRCSLLHSLSAAVTASDSPLTPNPTTFTSVSTSPHGYTASSKYISPPSCPSFLQSSLSSLRRIGTRRHSLLSISSGLNIRMASNLALPNLRIFDAIARHNPYSPAIVHCLSGRTFNYGELLPDICRMRDRILKEVGRSDIRGERIAFLVENGYDYVVTFLAILACRAIALPLSPPFPAPELQYILSHSEAILLLHSAKFAPKAKETVVTPSNEPAPSSDPAYVPQLKAVEIEKHLGMGTEPTFYDTVDITQSDDTEGAGMMLYTSGTTARPKGVLLPESALTAQCQALVEAWKYSPEDRLLHCLPLHHIHGTVNAVLTPLFAGSTIEFLFPFNADTVWRRFANPYLEVPKANGVMRATKLNGIMNGFTNGTTNGHSNGVTNGHPTPPSSVVNGVGRATSEPTGSALPATITDRISQVAAELYGIVQLASGCSSSAATAGVTLSPRETNRISELAVELNDMIRSPPSAVPTPSYIPRLNSLVHTNSTAETSPMTSGMSTPITTGTTDDEKFAHMSRAKITFFTVVPTVYTRLLSTHKTLTPALAEAGRVAISPENMRVSISGSAALPTPVKRAWKDLSRGNVLLERYGMTEVGMALSCGLDYADRVDGSVGWPLPGVEARLFDTDKNEVIPDNELERAGEIQLRGKNVFREYWANPTATAKEFVQSEDDQGAWFKTGDVAVRREVSSAGSNIAASGSWAHGPMYFILGRSSADIIKSGGEKVSALEVERELLSLPEVLETAVMAVPSGKWGQKVGAVVILDKNLAPNGWKPMDMRRALRGRLANYKIPQVLRVVDSIQRNAMGKVNKKELVKRVFVDDFSGDEM